MRRTKNTEHTDRHVIELIYGLQLKEQRQNRVGAISVAIQ